MLSVPIVSHDRVIGVMNVQTVEVHDFLPDRSGVRADAGRPGRGHHRIQRLCA